MVQVGAAFAKRRQNLSKAAALLQRGNDLRLAETSKSCFKMLQVYNMALDSQGLKNCSSILSLASASGRLGTYRTIRQCAGPMFLEPVYASLLEFAISFARISTTSTRTRMSSLRASDKDPFGRIRQSFGRRRHRLRRFLFSCWLDKV